MENKTLDSKRIKKTKITIAILAALLMIASIIWAVLLSQPKPHIYIALGDSIPSGYGLDGYSDSPEGVYTIIFFELLENAGYVDEYHNMARSGSTTTDLLESLREMNDEELLLFRNARVVTINIGGNNVLTPFLAYMSELQAVSGALNIQEGADGMLAGGWRVIYEIVSGVRDAVSADGDVDFSTDEVITGFGDLIAGLGELILGTGEIIAGAPHAADMWTGEFSTELTAALDEGVQAFTEDFSQIIMWLENHAPRATVIVNTIFNPIPQEILNISMPIAALADTLLKQMNDKIFEESETRSFYVADIRPYLTHRQDLTDFNINPFAGPLSFDLVHPNAEGHYLIAQTVSATFIRANRVKLSET